MMNSKKEVIKSFLFEGTDDMKKEKFELTWDIYNLLPNVWEEIKIDFFNNHINPGLAAILGQQFYVHRFIFRDRVWYFNLPITQESWLVNNNPFYVIKLNRNNGGYYELLLERWGKLPSDLMHLEESIIHTVKSVDDTITSYSDKGGFRAVFKKSFKGENLKDIDFITNILMKPESERQNILNMFIKFRDLLNLKTYGKSVEELITDIVDLVKRRK